MVAKLSSVRIMSAASLVTSVPVMPIATPMSARFSAGASLTPSPVMATTLPWRLRVSTRRTLSSGATRATTPISSSCRSSSSSCSAANSAPGERAALDAELAGDGRGRRRVVAGDHADADARLLAERDRVPGLLAGRVDDPDEREQRQVLHLRRADRRRDRSGRVEVPRGDGEHAQPLAGEAVVLGQHALAAVRRRAVRSRPASRIVRRAGEQHVGRALDEAAHDFPARLLHLVEGRHQLVVRVERHLADAREDASRLVDVEPALRGEDDERGLGRVADDLAVAHRRVVGERHRQQDTARARCRTRPPRAGSCRPSSSPPPRPCSAGPRATSWRAVI